MELSFLNSVYILKFSFPIESTNIFRNR